ncbi:MAG: lyase family protein, partial [Pseudomonadota bacterium]
MSDARGITQWPSLPIGLPGALLDDAEMGQLFSAEAEIEAMLTFERALARAQHDVGELTAEALAAVETCASPDRLDQSALLAGIGKDGLAVPAMVQQLREAIGEPHAKAFHRGSTSQDVIDTALMLRLKQAVAVLIQRLDGVLEALSALSARVGAEPAMARTRFQDALPFTLGDRIATWIRPLQELRAASPSRFPLQFGGAIGLREASYGANHQEIAARIAAELGLHEPGEAWHTDRRAILDLLTWCSALATVLGKLGQDIAIMAQTPVAEMQTPGGTSSAMPHKNNPVAAELLVTLARYVSGHLSILQFAALHENERSGIAWTQEWLVIPPAMMATAVSTRRAHSLIA